MCSINPGRNACRNRAGIDLGLGKRGGIGGVAWHQREPVLSPIDNLARAREHTVVHAHRFPILRLPQRAAERVVAGVAWCVVLLALPSPASGQEGVADPAAAAESSDFVRFRQEEHRGLLETAIVRYARPDGGMVDLIGVVHIGDTVYYEELNKRLGGYDALLYELVGNPEDLKDAGKLASSQNPMRMLQRMVKTMLKLDYQLDAIDYTRPNFVHADLDMEAFQDLQAERGENIFTILQNAMRKASEGGVEGGAPASSLPLDIAPILAALGSPDSASALKLVVAEQFDKAEQLLDSVEAESGTVILTERNKHVMKVLEAQAALGKEQLGVFYGAAHLVDLERRLRESGYRRAGQEWLTAWDIPKPPKAVLPEPPGAGAGAAESPGTRR